jgi:hypothetical protein
MKTREKEGVTEITGKNLFLKKFKRERQTRQTRRKKKWKGG